MKTKTTVKYGCGSCETTIEVSTYLSMEGEHPSCLCHTNVPMYEEERIVSIVK